MPLLSRGGFLTYVILKFIPVSGISWVLLEFGNAIGFVLGPEIVPNPPEDSINNGTSGEVVKMRQDIMNLMYLRE